MFLRKISFLNWRKFRELNLKIPENSFYILDENGSGKTSILSGIYTVLTGLAFPETKFRDSVRNAENYFGIKSENNFVSGAFVGRVNIKKEGEFLHPLQVHTYIPTDNLWFFQARSSQLKKWDQILSQVFGQDYEKPLKVLENAVKNKNILLKNESFDEKLYLNYTNLIHKNSLKIWQFRDVFFQDLNMCLKKFLTWTNVKEEVKIEILRTNFAGIRLKQDLENAESEEFLQNIWSEEMVEKLRQKERWVGKTLYSAGRDEVNFLVNGANINTQFSRGEMRAFVVFLKKFVREKFLGNVLWLLDDIFNEFDEERENIILKELVKEGDFLIATGTKKLPKNMLFTCKIEDLEKF